LTRPVSAADAPEPTTVEETVAAAPVAAPVTQPFVEPSNTVVVPVTSPPLSSPPVPSASVDSMGALVRDPRTAVDVVPRAGANPAVPARSVPVGERAPAGDLTAVIVPTPPVAAGTDPGSVNAVSDLSQPAASTARPLPIPQVTTADGPQHTASAEVPPVAMPAGVPEAPVPVTSSTRTDSGALQADAVARFVAMRGHGAVTEAVGTPAEVRPVAPGLAIARLAQTLGRLKTEEGAPVMPPVLAATPVNTVEVATVHTGRAAEVLLRLAQAGAPVAPRPSDSHSVLPITTVPIAVADVGGPVPAAAAPPATAVVSLPPAVGEQVTSQIVSSLKLQWRDGVGEAKLHLRPDALGQVSLTLRVEQGAVTAVVRAESPQVQEWVLQHQQVLRQQLHDAGLRLDDLTVNPDGEQAQQGGQGQQQNASEESAERQSRRRAPRTSSGLHFDQLL